MAVRVRYITRSRFTRCGWARKPIYFAGWVWMLPGMASKYRKLRRLLSEADVVAMIGRDVAVGELVPRTRNGKVMQTERPSVGGR